MRGQGRTKNTQSQLVDQRPAFVREEKRVYKNVKRTGLDGILASATMQMMNLLIQMIQMFQALTLL
jgi:hypothetical protein